MEDKYQYFNGYKFTRDEHTGYYLSSKRIYSSLDHKEKRRRLHRCVWEFYNGAIPSGYEVHHIDGDKSNNDISNLQLLSNAEHMKLHGATLTEEEREWRRQNLAKTARPKASEWHKSEEGRKWHKQHYEQMKDKFHTTYTVICANCGKEFQGTKDSKYCCNACKSAYRRKSGVDNIEKICIICGNTFITDKYSGVETCSKACTSKYTWKLRKGGIQNESEIRKEHKKATLGI